MRLPVYGLLALLIVSCGKSDSSPETHVSIPEKLNWKGLGLSSDISEDDMTNIPNLLPTMYYTPKEADASCKGGYGRRKFNGNEKTKLLDPEGNTIATVCSRYASMLLMEGSGILKDRGQGEIAVNYGGKIRNQPRYHYLNRCKFGEGIRKDLCLLPYHTIAADNKVHQIDEIIFVPEARGLALPDGTTHDGFFIVRDTGGAFNGIGSQRVDMFVGTDPDFSNAFQRAGFHHKRPMTAFKVIGSSAEAVKEKLRAQFGEIY